ncbi:hypothetical protein [Aliiroseovarius sp. YM-037]
MIRLAITFVLCAVAFWAGMSAERFVLTDRCLDAGGAVRGDGVCYGVEGE